MDQAVLLFEIEGMYAKRVFRNVTRKNVVTVVMERSNGPLLEAPMLAVLFVFVSCWMAYTPETADLKQPPRPESLLALPFALGVLRYPDGAFESRYPLHIEECSILRLQLFGELWSSVKQTVEKAPRCFARKELGH